MTTTAATAATAGTEVAVTFRSEIWSGADSGWTAVRAQKVTGTGADAEKVALDTVRTRMASYLATLARDGRPKQRSRIIKVIEVSGLHEEVVE